MGKKLSIGSWAFVFNQETVLDFHTTLHKLQHMKFDGIELGSFGVHPTPKSHPTKASRLALKKEVADHGLGFSGIAVDLWSFKPISQEDPLPYLCAFLGYCSFAQDLGMDMIRVDTCETPQDVLEKHKVDPKVGMDRIINAWDIACKMAADHGLKVSWEFEPGFVFNKASEVVKIVDAVKARGHKNFGLMYDSCHAHMTALGSNQVGEKETVAGGALGVLKMLEGRINHIHLIDSDGSLNEHKTSTHNPFGTGHINFDELLPAIEKAGIDTKWWAIDLCFWPDAWNVTAQCKKYLDAMRAKYAA